MSRITIIIPVYNTAKLIDRCINSIRNQSFTDWTALLIDDGSSDESGNICDKWNALDPRIQSHHKQNGGLSSARNFGLALVQTDYVTFIDSDDFISQDWLSTLYAEATTHNADITMGGYTRIRGNNALYTYPPSQAIPVYRVYSPEEILEFCILPLFGKATNAAIPIYFSSVCDKLFRSEFLHGHSFPSEREIISEDNLFSLKQFLRIPRFIFIPHYGYQYLENESSLTSQYSFKHIHGFIKYLTSLESLCNLLPDPIDGRNFVGIQTFYRITSLCLTVNPFLNRKGIRDLIQNPNIQRLISYSSKRLTISENLMLFAFRSKNLALVVLFLESYWLLKRVLGRGLIKPNYIATR